MKELMDFSKVLGSMQTEALIALVMLAGFALAAYAIHAATKERK